MDKKQLIQKIESVLKQIYDPEIPVNIFDLGLIYDIVVDDKNTANITMTLTAPNCPAADAIVKEVHDKVAALDGIDNVDIHLTFDPPWDISKASEVAKLQLGML